MNLNGLKYVASFAAGIAAGAVFMKKRSEKKYNEKLTEALNDIRNGYSKEKKAPEEVKDEKEEMMQTKEEVKVETENVVDTYEEPYEISYDDFGEKKGYRTRSLIWYPNGRVLTEYLEVPDEDGTDEKIISNWNALIGDAVASFETIEDDTIYVRNEKEKSDFEIMISDKDAPNEE